jgi:gamma-glutamyltranspeptidase/glutathione hydrolase
MKHLFIYWALLFLNVPFIFGQVRYSGSPFAYRSEAIAKNGMAATSQPLATQVAIDVLKKGGNAVDAAIAANALLGLVEPTGNGIGGDLFAIVWDAKTKQLYGLNASGRSPKGLTIDYFKQNNMEVIPNYGALSVSVPGCVDGWYSLHEKFGSLEMKELLQPAIEYAREGFPVTEVIAVLWAGYARSLQRYDGYRELYMPNGETPKKGEVFKNPGLANTLEKIAQGGRDAFYKGEIAHTIADFVKKEEGFLAYEDLASHYSEWVDPVSTNYRGYDVWELPPNGQGIAALQILNILEQYDIAEMGFGSAEYVHTFIEAKKLAYEDRARHYADMAFSKVPVDKLISKEYAKKRKALIDPNQSARRYDAGELEHGNTIYLTVADKEGNMVSLIQSNYSGMGSGICPPGLGFSLQNRGNSFNVVDEKHPNAFEPGKRPFHTIIPAFITKEGQPYISFGLMGGAMQPQGHAQIVVNLIDFKMNLQEAGDAPRIRHIGSSSPSGFQMSDGGTVILENGFDGEVIYELIRKGHRMEKSLRGFGGYQAIMFDVEKGVYFGATESRKDGIASGY